MLHVYDRSLQWTLRHRRFTMRVLALYVTPVLYLYMESAQKYRAYDPDLRRLLLAPHAVGRPAGSDARRGTYSMTCVGSRSSDGGM